MTHQFLEFFSNLRTRTFLCRIKKKNKKSQPDGIRLHIPLRVKTLIYCYSFHTFSLKWGFPVGLSESVAVGIVLQSKQLSVSGQGTQKSYYDSVSFFFFVQTIFVLLFIILWNWNLAGKASCFMAPKYLGYNESPTYGEQTFLGRPKRCQITSTITIL